MAAAASPVPVQPSIPQLRALHRRSVSNIHQAFFDDDDEADRQPTWAGSALFGASSRFTGLVFHDSQQPHRVGAPSAETNCDDGAQRTEGPGAHTIGDPYAAFGEKNHVAACGSADGSRDPLRDFTRAYEGSSNPYLRAAAMELQGSPLALPHTQASNGVAGWHGMLKSTPELTHCVNDKSGVAAADAAVGGGGSAAFLPTTSHKAPQLFRPVGKSFSLESSANQEPFTSRADFGQIAALSGKDGPSPPKMLRGIPLFPYMRRNARPSSSSLRQSLEEYGQLQLQDEAVHWYHRSSELEHQLTQLQEAYDRQSKLLAAQWRGAEQRRSAEPALEPETTLTSRSPDSLTPAYAEGQGLECVPGSVVEADRVAEASFSAPRTAAGEAVLGGVSETTMHYAVPKPHSEDGEGSHPSATIHPLITEEFVGTSSAVHSLIRRGNTEAATASAHQSRRSSVGVQTDAAVPSTGASFLGEDGAAVERGSTVEGASPVAAPPTPSAILAKQYAEAVDEVESMRLRLDVSEREAADLREMCVAQDLRCDELETQLLAKEEQLMQHAQMQEQVQATADAIAENEVDGDATEPFATKSAMHEGQLRPLIARLTEFLNSVRRVQSDLTTSTGVVQETSMPDAGVEGGGTSLENGGEAPSEAPFSSPSHAEMDTVEPATQLASLVTQAHQSLMQFAQQYAALHAELEVVRADRNELIGEQSEQVRLLQQQLLEKDTAQLQLMEQLHRAQTLAVTTTATGSAEGERGVSACDPPMQELSASASADGHRVHDDDMTALPIVPQPQSCKSGERTQHALAEEIQELKAQLDEAKAAAAAAQEAQRRVLMERLEQAQAELRSTRLQAEDEYDHLSGTIEALTRELADTKEALRIKEVSLRIALRESSPPMLLLAASTPSTNDFTAPGAPPHLTEKPPRSLPTTPPLTALDGPHNAAATTTTTAEDGELDEEQRNERSLRTSSSPAESPSPSPAPAYRHPIDMGERKAGELARLPTSPLLSSRPMQRRGEKFVDDGTLRTLPSSIHIETDGSEGGGGCAGQGTAHPVVSSSSREKSSRGLTTSAGAASHSTSLPSFMRGRSGSGGTESNTLGHAQSNELEAVHSEDAMPVPRAATSRVMAEASQATEGSAASTWKREFTSSSQDVASTSTAEALPRSAESAITRDSTSTHVIDAAAAENVPLPLRGPLFGHPPTPLPTDSASPSPVQNRTPPSQLSERSTTVAATGTTQGYLRKSAASSPLSSLSSPSLPEERLRRFLASSAGTAALSDVVYGEVAGSANAAATSAHTAVGATPRGEWLTNVRGSSGDLFAGATDDGVTPARTPVSLLSERTPHVSSSSPPTAGSTPSSGFGGSPSPSGVSAVAARHTQASLRRHREVWQQQQSLLQSLLSSPSP